jgi:subtilase family serine protease
MLKTKHLPKQLLGATIILFCGMCPVFAAGWKILPGHVPRVVSSLTAKGLLPATNQLRLAIGLPLRDVAGLDNFLAQVFDPASPTFRQYLTPEEFTARFGPTEQDYEAVKNFARTNGLAVTTTYGNRLVLDVAGPAAAVESAFHVTLRTYRHPTEVRNFFAPDVEPTVDAALPVVDIQGLSDFSRPHPKLHRMDAAAVAKAVTKSGSAPDGSGSYFGNDFRNAYVPGTTLTGAGQMVGLVEFDGFYSKDIAAYATAAGAGRTDIVIQTVLLDGYNGVPTTGANSGNVEVALDIEMAMAMAPGLSKIIVFSGGPNGAQNDVLNAMAANNTVKNLSCGWGWGGGPSATTDAIFRQMAAQGQSFFNASGDNDAFTTGANSVNGVDNPSLANAPSSSPYITQVGGTTLTTTGPGGAWQSETVWNWGGGSGSSGGISSYYSIPAWQTNVSMTVNQGSTTKRNIPDVALTADNVYCYSDNGQSSSEGGTSCAAPLWAGLTALANQQAATTGKPAVGFVNPTVYAIGTGSDYAQDFHDITTGDNTWSSSPSRFYAVKGYDLCTGWGTPAGQNFIDDLVAQGNSPANSLGIISGLVPGTSGVVGGPFNSPASVIILTNSGKAPLTWTLVNPNAVTWLKVSPAGGTLGPQATTNVILNFTAAVTNLAVGNYSASLEFSNRTSATVQLVTFQLQVLPVLSVLPATGFTATGPVGGPFVPAAQDFTISNLGGTPAVWKVVGSKAWLAVSQSSGTVAAGSQTNFTVTLTEKANELAAGIYKTTVSVRNKKNQIVQKLPFTLRIGQNIVSNGGFETGDFSGWNLNAASTQVGSLRGLVHSGHYGAELGQPGTLGYLSQTLPTTAGHIYLLSLWIDNPQNPYGATPNEFLVQWEGATIYDGVDLPFSKWTNLKFYVTATNSGSLLQFGFQDDLYYLGLDDISVKSVETPKIQAVTRTPVSFDITFSASTRAFYQLQYKTNLTQPDWIDVGSRILAETNSLKFTDTNIVNYSQKFYRLILAP